MDIYSNAQGQNPLGQAPQYPEQSRSTEALVLGILSLTCCGLITGIPAWIIGVRDLEKIDKNLISPSFKTETKAGMILGIIGTAGSTLMILFIVGVVGLVFLRNDVVTSNRLAVNRDLHFIAKEAQEYYKRPRSLGGGGGSYKEFSIPYTMRENSDGTYSAAVYDQEVIITGTGVQKGRHGDWILHEILVTPDTVFIRRLN